VYGVKRQNEQSHLFRHKHYTWTGVRPFRAVQLLAADALPEQLQPLAFYLYGMWQLLANYLFSVSIYSDP